MSPFSSRYRIAVGNALCPTIKRNGISEVGSLAGQKDRIWLSVMKVGKTPFGLRKSPIVASFPYRG